MEDRKRVTTEEIRSVTFSVWGFHKRTKASIIGIKY